MLEWRSVELLSSWFSCSRGSSTFVLLCVRIGAGNISHHYERAVQRCVVLLSVASVSPAPPTTTRRP